MIYRLSQKARVLGALSLTLALTGAGSLGAQDDDTASGAPEKIDLSSFPGEIVDQVVVPIPAEIFGVLDKLGDPNWVSGIIIPEDHGKTSDRAILALTFGSFVAEGFIAVQAKSVEDIQKIGREVLTLSESLGLADAVRPHSLSIIEAAGDRNWDEVRDELDSTQQTVRNTMERLRDDELSELVSLGGWLRGTHVVTSFISDSYTGDKAELLNQPGLISHFSGMLDSMSGPSKASAQIRSIADGLVQLEAIITSGEPISEEDINQIRDISKNLLDEFYFDETAEAGSVD